MLEVFFLGTGGIMPTKERNVSSTAIKYNGESILLDCGEGTQRQMQMTNVSPMSIENIFISHFHGDHYIGLLPLIQSMSLLDREKKLDIYGPKMTENFIKNLLTSGFLGLEFPIYVHEITGKEKIEFNDYFISTFKTKHGIPSLGYVFKEKDKRGKFNVEKAKSLGLEPGPKFRELENGETVIVNGRKIEPDEVIGEKRIGRKIVYSGDTKPTSNTVKKSENADLLIHECTFLEEDEREDSYHTIAEEAINLARKADAKTLAMVHRSPRYKHEEYKESIHEKFDIDQNKCISGLEVIIPKDLQRIEITMDEGKND